VTREKRVVDSPMVLSYDGVFLWKAAVERAGSFEVDKVRAALESGSISFDGPGGKIVMQPNHHTTKNVYVGETKADGQFRIIQAFARVYGEPFLLQSLDEKLSAK
jgi:urea transport system substrate-binding protein